MRETKRIKTTGPRWLMVLALALACAFMGAVIADAVYAAPETEEFAPAPQKILFTRNAQLFLMNADGADQTLFNVGAYNAYDPTWSPDGSKVAFVCGLEPIDICTANADGTGFAQLTYDSGFNNEPAWSPDGAKIAFTSYRDGDARVYLMNADGSDQTPLEVNHPQMAETSSPAWSPDGSRIAFAGATNGGTEIFAVEINNPSNVAQMTYQTFYGAIHPSWSPDGQRIAFTNSKNVYSVPSDGSGASSQLTTGEHDIYTPAWSPDGNLIAFNRQRTVRDDDGQEIERIRGVAVVSASGGNLMQIEAQDGYAPAWKPLAGNPEPTPTPTPGENQPPVAVAKNVELSAGENGTASLTAYDVDGGSYDPDAEDLVTLSINTSGPFGVGVHKVELTATDNHGASHTTEAFVSVVDRTAPVVTSQPEARVLSTGDGCQSFAPDLRGEISATDNVTPSQALLVTQEPQAGSPLALGTHFVTLTVSDAAGNQTQRFINVSVKDDVSPTLNASLSGNGFQRQGYFRADFSATDNCAEGLRTRAVMASPTEGQHFRVVYESLPGLALASEIEFDAARQVVTLRGANEQAVRQLFAQMMEDGGARLRNTQSVFLQLTDPRNRREASKHVYSFYGAALVRVKAAELRMVAVASDSSLNITTKTVVPGFGR